MKTATYTVMFTDIQDFTGRTSRQTRAQNERLLRLHDELLLPVIQGYLGRRVKTIGDAYLVVFDSATRALACGAAIQDRLARFNLEVEEDERIEVRIAMSAGEVRLVRGDVFGEAVNIASRVEGLARGGEVYFTESVFLLADRAGFDLEDLGSHELKGIPERVGIFRLRPLGGAELPFGGDALNALDLPPFQPRERGFRRAAPKAGLMLAMVAFAALGGFAMMAWLAPA